MMRKILFGQEQERIRGHRVDVENFGSGVRVKMYNLRDVEVGAWVVSELMLGDPTLVKIHPKGHVEVQAVLPRILIATYDQEEDSLRIAEVEIGQIIPP